MSAPFQPGDHVAPSVDAYLHDLLKAEEARCVEEHCAHCAACAEALDAARHRTAALCSLPAIRPTEELIQLAVRQVQRQRRAVWFSHRASLLLLAAAIVGVAGTQWYCTRLTPSPYDLVVLGQEEWLAGSEAALRVLVVDRARGVPVPGVPIEVNVLEKPAAGPLQTVHLATLVTDAAGAGAPQFRVPEGSAEYELQVQARLPASVETVQRKIVLRRAARLALTTDKPAYQPGQTLHLRVAVQGPGGPLAGATAQFALADAEGNRLYHRSVATSGYGVAAADCPLAETLSEGTYQALCTASGSTAAVSIVVKKHTLPKIIVEARLDRSFYSPQQPIVGEIRARYRSGNPVAGARVMLQLETTDVVPRLVEDLAGQSDAQGQIGFRLPPKPDLFVETLDAPDVGCRLNVAVTDGGGEKGAISMERPVTSQGIRLQAIPEGGTLVPGVVNRIYLLARYPDGRPARCRVAIEGDDRELITNEFGTAVWEGTPEPPRLVWALRADDDQGQSGRRRFVFPCEETPDDFLFRTDRAVYDVGAKVKITAASRDSAPLLVDLIHDGQTVAACTLSLADGTGQCVQPLPATLWGAVQVCAYRYGAEGLARRKVRTLYVRPAGGLRVQAEAGAATHRPGTRAKVRVSVADQRGQPLAAELGLVAADAALSASFEARQGLLAGDTSADRALLRSMSELGLWEAEALPPQKAQQRDLLELAIFSRSAAEQPGLRAAIRDILRERLETPDDVLELLGRPDWEALVRRHHIPDKSLAVLRGELHGHTLRLASYPAKAYRIEARRQILSAGIRRAWMGVAVLTAVVLAAGLFGFRPLGCLLTVSGLVLGGYFVFRAPPANPQSADDPATVHALRQFSAALETTQNIHELNTPAVAEATPTSVAEWLEQHPAWLPQVQTDAEGHAAVEVDLPAGGQSQQLLCRALSKMGAAGNARTPLAVQQPACTAEIDAPPRLAVGDEVEIRVTLSSHHASPQTARIKFPAVPWCETLEPREQALELAPAQVRAVRQRLRCLRAGSFNLQVELHTADGPTTISQPVELEAPGKQLARAQGGSLQNSADVELHAATGATAGSLRALLTIYPSALSRVVGDLEATEGRTALAFEEAAAAVYPPLVLLKTLQRMRLDRPDLEHTARLRLEIGYQRLAPFEVSGGGFDSFGRAPADPLLTAFALTTLEDLTRIYEVDPQRVSRTRERLLALQDGDGSWGAATAATEDPAHPQHLQALRTAYVAAAAFVGCPQHARAARTLGFLRRFKAGDFRDPYLLAQMAEALRVLEAGDDATRPWLEALERQVRLTDDNALAWWEQPAGYRPVFGRSVRNSQLETTALAVTTLLAAGRRPNCLPRARTWLLDQQDREWPRQCTPAQIRVWKAVALLDAERPEMLAPQQLRILLDKQAYRTLDISAAQGSRPVVCDLAEPLERGARLLHITAAAAPAARYRLHVDYHTADSPQTPEADLLKMHLACDRTKIAVNERTTVRATIVNQMPVPARLLFVELPIPAGTIAEPETLDIQLRGGVIAAYRLLPGRVVAALRNLEPERPLRVEYLLRGTTAAKSVAPVARVYDYYAPDKQALSCGEPLEVTAKP